jgi:biopolymer transport protein ExbB/TolQ
MIEIFGSQSPTGTNPQQLAHGISIALYNTAFGIAIAIPALIFYRHFRNKVDGFVVVMEQEAGAPRRHRARRPRRLRSAAAAAGRMSGRLAR